MKIVFFSSDNYAASGAFRAEINLIKDLQKRGDDVTLVLPYWGNGTKVAKSNNIKIKKIFSSQWVRPNNNGFRSLMLKTFYKPVNSIANRRTIRFLNKTKPDLAVINTLWTGVGAKAAKKCNIPVVWHLREILEVGQNHIFIKPNDSYNLINESKICLAVSECVKTYYNPKIDPSKVKVIYDGVDKNIFYNPDKKLFNEDKAHFLMMGTVNEQKGQHIGIKALNELSKYNFDVKIVGKCNKKYKDFLLKLAPNIAERITFVPPTKNPQEFYKQSDIFLMNSVGEAFGLVTVEAMMGGLVTIASDCDGSKEIVGNSVHGYFYKPQDYLDLASTIKKVLDDKENAIKIAQAGQTRAIQYFDKKINSEKIRETYLLNIKK